MKRPSVKTTFLLLAGFAALVLASQPAFSQTGAGSVSGTVRDANEAVIPGASITLTNSETNVSYKTESSAVGTYYFGEIPRGPYSLAVEKQGFNRWEGKLTLEVGQTSQI